MENQKEQISIDEMKHFIGGLMLDRYIAERQLSQQILLLEQRLQKVNPGTQEGEK